LAQTFVVTFALQTATNPLSNHIHTLFLMSFKTKLDLEKLPAHVAIIMDGNGRWAKQRGQMRVFGHQNGVAAVREASEGAAELGVKYLTLYAFSTENWSRPPAEVTALMTLLVSTIRKEVATLNKNNVRLQAIGNLTGLPDNCFAELMEAIAATQHNTGLTLVLALNYSSRWEITRATRLIAEKVKNGILNPDTIDDTVISQHLTTANMPDPELLIRTSGEQRISNFLLWQLSYAELYFTETMWPDFTRETLYEAIYLYQNRERRFGMTGEQVQGA
jgi:undecaprenyl diphosphate synthase